MNPPTRPDSITRRDFVRTTSALAAAALAGGLAAQSAEPPAPASEKSAPPKPPGSNPSRSFLTPADKFRDVSRGDPKPHTLKGDALVQARLTPETWRLEITADKTPNPAIKESASLSKPLTLANSTALDLPALQELGETHAVKFL